MNPQRFAHLVLRLRTPASACALLLLAACVSAPWEPVASGPATPRDGSFSVELPAGWIRFNLFGAGTNFHASQVAATRDGFALHAITVVRVPHKKAFEKLKRDSSADMPPAELADLLIAEFRADSPALEVLENVPATIAGHAGFRLQLRERNEEGLRIDRLIHGFADADGFYLVSYRAPFLHYYARDLAAFEAVVASLKLRDE